MSRGQTTLELSADDCADTRAKYLFLICGLAMNQAGRDMLELAAQVMGSYRQLDRPEPVSEWQPIETAKRDGEKILLYLSEGNIVDGWWEPKEEDGLESMGHDAGWHDDACSVFPGRSFGNPKYYSEPINPPTHWQPLPEPPEEQTP